MIRRRGSACARHRAALLDFVDRRETSGATDAALAHLDRCPACEGELAEITVAITALRRMAAEARSVHPPDDAWRRLRSRIDRPSAPAWVGRLSLGSLMLTAAVVAMVLAPSVAWRTSGGVFQEPGTDPAVIEEAARAWIAGEVQTEIRYVNSGLPGPAGEIVVWQGRVPRADPDRAREGRAPTETAVVTPPLTRAE